MVGHVAVEAKPAEPAIGEVEMHLLAQPPLGADAEAVADDQHPDHQLGIDRRPADRAVEGAKLPSQLDEVDEAIDRPQQMIGRHMPLERELVEQRSLLDVPIPIMIFSPASRRD